MKTNQSINYTVLLSFIFLASCDLVSKNNGIFIADLVIETEKTEYEFGSSDTIEVSLKNSSGFSLFRLVPRTVGLDKKIDGKWEELGVWYLTVAMVPRLMEIEDGEVLIAAAPTLTADNEIFEDPGEYRFNFAIFNYDAKNTDQPAKSSLLPEEKRVSNSFFLVEEEDL